MMDCRRRALVSLDTLGIVSLNLASAPIGATTPQGTQLIAGGEVTFAWAANNNDDCIERMAA